MNPFEIRAQMLEMAQDYLQKQYEVNLEFSKRAFDDLVKAGDASSKEYAQYIPKMYNLEEITKKANELYSFVKEK